MTYLVGIAGGTGTGKGTIAELLQKHLKLWGLSCEIFSTDDAYKDLSYLSERQRKALCFNKEFNYDHPKVVDFEKLVFYAREIKAGRDISYSKYDFERHCYQQQSRIELPPELDVGIIEGIYALYSGPEVGKELLSLYDLKLFVVTDTSIALLRRIQRDIKERGRELPDVIAQLRLTVIPMQREYIDPTQENAHYTIDWKTDESQDFGTVKQRLLCQAREKAFSIFETVMKSKGQEPLLPELKPDDMNIPQITNGLEDIVLP